MNKKLYFFNISIRTVPKIEWYCSYVIKIMAFGTSHERDFLMFGVSNAKYLTFDTPDENALSNRRRYAICQIFGIWHTKP